MTEAVALGQVATRPLRLLQLVRRYPLLSYFFIAYVASWTYDLLFLVLFPLPDIPARSSPRDLGPSIAALVVTAVIAGKPGLRRLWRRCLLWRVGGVWYLFIFLGIPAIYLLGILVVPGALASFKPPSPAGLLLYPVLFLFILVLGGPLCEEPGWRGFALPRLQERCGPLVGTLVLGVLWASWHAPEYLVPDFAAANGGLSLTGVGVYLLALICLSIIITWVFNHTGGSILVAMLLHMMINASQVVMRDLFPAAGSNEIGPVAAFGLAALLIVVATRGRLGYGRSGEASVRDGSATPAGAGPSEATGSGESGDRVASGT